MRKAFGLVSCVWALLASGCPGQAGGGGCTQDAPDSVRAGEPAVIELECAVWGSHSGVKGRFSNVVVSYRLVGEGEYRPLSPRVVSQEKNREVYEAVIPAYPKGTRGEIEYYIDLKLDNQTTRINGYKKIRIYK